MADPTTFTACPKCGEENIEGVLLVYADFLELEERDGYLVVQDWQQEPGLVDSEALGNSLARCSSPDCDWQITVYPPTR